MPKMYEYKFERIEAKFFSGLTDAEEKYRDTIYEHGLAGWRLVQIFAPGLNLGRPDYYEMIFERERESNT